MGIATYQTPELVIKQFCRLQTVYGIAARGGSRVFHEVLEIKEDEFVKLGYDYARVWETAITCEIHCHGGNKGIHIHFVVNTISFLTGKKWHTSMRRNYTREQNFNDCMREAMVPDAFKTELPWD